MADRQRIGHLGPSSKNTKAKANAKGTGRSKGSSKSRARGGTKEDDWTQAPIKNAGPRAASRASKRHEREVDDQTKRTVLSLLFLGGLIIVAGWGAFSYFIPHTNVEMTTVWHEAWSGKFVQCSVENKGTNEMSDLSVTLSVWNGTELMNSRGQGEDTLKPGDLFTLDSFQFYGESVETFTVVLELTFTIEEEQYSPTYSYKAKDYQNHNWRENIFEWG